MCEQYYDKMQPHFVENNLEHHYIDTDSFIFSFKRIKGLFEAWKRFTGDFDSSDLDPSHELFSEEKKVFEKLKLETAPELDLDDAISLGSKSYFFISN